jgi:hypothetical protein
LKIKEVEDVAADNTVNEEDKPYILPTLDCLNLPKNSNSAGFENELYHETRLNYTDVGSYNTVNGICFGNYSSGDFSVYGVGSSNIWGSMMFTWLNSGTYAHSGPGLYWKVPNGGNIYIKAAVESRTYSGTKVTLKGKLYMPINVFFTSFT